MKKLNELLQSVIINLSLLAVTSIGVLAVLVVIDILIEAL